MNIIEDVRRQLEEFKRNGKDFLKTSQKVLVNLFKLLRGGLKTLSNKIQGEKSFKQFIKEHPHTMTTESNLSKEDVLSLNKYAKNNKLKYAVIKVIPNGKVKGMGRFERFKEKLGLESSKYKETPSYRVIYDSKDHVVMTEGLEKVVTDRISRQSNLDPSLRTDFNNDGIVDDKDYIIDTKTTELKAENIQYGKEYGVTSLSEFANINRTVYYISNEDFVEHRMSVMATGAFSAFSQKDLENQDVIAITVASNNALEVEELFKDNNLNYDTLEISCNTKEPVLDISRANQIVMTDEDYQKFKKEYTNINYNAEKTMDAQEQAKWKVIICKDDVKKNYESNIKKSSLENSIKEIQLQEELNISMETPKIDAELEIDDIDIDIDIGK